MAITFANPHTQVTEFVALAQAKQLLAQNTLLECVYKKTVFTDDVEIRSTRIGNKTIEQEVPVRSSADTLLSKTDFVGSAATLGDNAILVYITTSAASLDGISQFAAQNGLNIQFRAYWNTGNKVSLHTNQAIECRLSKKASVELTGNEW